MFRSGDVNKVVQAIAGTLRVWALFGVGVAAASALAVGLDRLGANDPARFALPLCVLIAVFGVYVLGVRTVLDPLSQSVLEIMDSLAQWARQIQFGFVLRGAAALGLPLAVGAIVLFVLLEMAEGVRAVGLAAFAAVGVASSIELMSGALSTATELLKRPPLPGEAPRELAQALRVLPILGQAEAADVYGIYRRCTSAQEGEREIWTALEAQLRSGVGEFRVIGVAAPSLFGPGPTLRLFEEYMPRSDVKVRAILADDKSQWARVRAGLEQGHTTMQDIPAGFAYLEWMRAQWGQRVEYRATDIALPAFVVITDEWAFVEPYPIAEVRGPLDGRTPLLKLRSGTEVYKIWSDTFELLWQYPRLEELDKRARDLAP